MIGEFKADRLAQLYTEGKLDLGEFLDVISGHLIENPETGFSEITYTEHFQAFDEVEWIDTKYLFCTETKEMVAFYGRSGLTPKDTGAMIRFLPGTGFAEAFGKMIGSISNRDFSIQTSIDERWKERGMITDGDAKEEYRATREEFLDTGFRDDLDDVDEVFSPERMVWQDEDDDWDDPVD